MARTKQTARKSRGGRAPRKILRSQTHDLALKFKDHNGKFYTVVGGRSGYNNPPAIKKLSIHLYSLQPLVPSAEAVAEQLLTCTAMSNSGDRTNYWPRIDVYTPQDSIEECIQHHRKEKKYRQNAIQAQKLAAIRNIENTNVDTTESQSRFDNHNTNNNEEEREEALEAFEQKKREAILNLRGKEPLPHIVPTWCRPRREWHQNDHHQRYASFILVVPQDCRTWNDIKSQGLWLVRFDQDISPEMETDVWDCESHESHNNNDNDDDDDTDIQCGTQKFVHVEKITYPPPTSILRACVHPVPPLFPLPLPALSTLSGNETVYDDTPPSLPQPIPLYKRWETPGCQINLVDAWEQMTGVLYDCTYRPVSCDGCDYESPSSSGRFHECEIELDEHYFDHEGYCIACKRQTEYRRRSTRIIARQKRMEREKKKKEAMR